MKKLFMALPLIYLTSCGSSYVSIHTDNEVKTYVDGMPLENPYYKKPTNWRDLTMLESQEYIEKMPKRTGTHKTIDYELKFEQNRQWISKGYRTTKEVRNSQKSILGFVLFVILGLPLIYIGIWCLYEGEI